MKADFKKILGPIAPIRAAGTFDPENETLSFLEAEIMKSGTLQHDEINWEEIEEKSKQYLSNICKDFKVLSFLGACMQRKGDPVIFLDSINLFAEFTRKYWKKGYPKPGNAGEKIKSKIMASAIGGMLKYSAKLKVFESDFSMLSDYKKSIKTLEATLKKHEIKPDSLKAVIDNFQAGIQSDVGKIKAESNPETKKAKVLTDEINEISYADERKIKQAYLILAKFTNEMSPHNPLGYMIRRFGLWHNINSIPPRNSNGNTEMPPVPEDKVSEYIEAVNNHSSAELLIRIEQTVVSSPFWINGSFMAANCAGNLGFSEVAIGIKSAVVEFLKRVPGLKDCSFSDGSRFVDDSTLAWALENKQTKDENNQNDIFAKIFKDKGLEFTLKEINFSLEETEDVRYSYYLRLIAAEYLAESEMVSLAGVQAKQISKEIKLMTVPEWEPMFIKRLNTLTKA